MTERAHFESFAKIGDSRCLHDVLNLVFLYFTHSFDTFNVIIISEERTKSALGPRTQSVLCETTVEK
jgi:hypothetical protein